MAALILPSRRVVQPQGPAQVDWGNPLALGANVWTPQRPFALQSANNVQPGAEIAYSSAPISAAGVGRQWTRSANAGINFGLQQIIRQNVGVTVLVLAAPRSQTALKVPVSQRVASGAFTQTELVFNCQDIAGITTATAGSVLLASYSDIGTGVAAASQIDGQPHCWVAGNSSTSGYIFRDGVNQTLAVNVRTPATLTTSTQRTRIGNIADDGSTTWPHDDPLYLVVVWDRMLSDSEARAVSANPWQLFRPLQRRIIVDMGAGGGGTPGEAAGTYSGLSLVAPAALGLGAASATAAPAVVSLSPITATAKGAATTTGALASVNLQAPTALGTGAAAALGAAAPVALTAPNAAAAGAITAFASFAATTLSAPTATSAGAGAAEGVLPGVSLTAPVATAVGATSASAAFAAIQLVAPSALAAGAAQVQPAFAAIALSSPQGAAFGGASGVAFALPASINLSAPNATGTGSAIASAAYAGLSLSAFTAVAAGGASAIAVGAPASLALVAPTGQSGGAAAAFTAWTGITLTPADGAATADDPAGDASGALAAMTLNAPNAIAFGDGAAPLTNEEMRDLYERLKIVQSLCNLIPALL